MEEPGRDVRSAHADHLLIGLDLIAAARRETRGGGDRVGQRHERDAHRGDQQRRRRRRRRSRGTWAWEPPWGARRPSPPRARRDRTPPRQTVAATTATSTAGSRRVMRGRTSSSASTASPTTSVVACVWSRPSKKTRTSFRNESASVEKPNSFGSCPTMIVIAEAVHVADLDLLGEEVGDEPELAQAQPDLREPDQHRQHAGESDRACRVAAARPAAA